MLTRTLTFAFFFVDLFDRAREVAEWTVDNRDVLAQ